MNAKLYAAETFKLREYAGQFVFAETTESKSPGAEFRKIINLFNLQTQCSLSADVL
jgi:hypothetical protein